MKSIWPNIKGKRAALSSNPEESMLGRRVLLVFKSCGKRGCQLRYLRNLFRYLAPWAEVSKKSIYKSSTYTFVISG